MGYFLSLKYIIGFSICFQFISVVAVIISIPAVYVSILVGTSGGEIRHTEIRENYLKTTGSAEETSPRNSKIKSENN